jgi:hypothetical protein
VCQSGQLTSEIDSPFDVPELHFLGVYEASNNHNVVAPASVHLDRGTNVVLVVSSYEAVHWTVTVENGTTLDKVIVNGYENHEWTVPNGVDVDDYSGPGNYIESSPYEWDAEGQDFVAAVEQMTGLEMSSFHGCYRANDFELGQQ